MEKIRIFDISFNNTEMELKNVRISNYNKCNEMEVSRWSFFICSFRNENKKDLQSFVCHLDESSSLNRDLVKPVHTFSFCMPITKCSREPVALKAENVSGLYDGRDSDDAVVREGAIVLPRVRWKEKVIFSDSHRDDPFARW